jgi:hypothetical protein
MLLHKLRRAMVNAAREPLHGEVEVDDTWIGRPQACVAAVNCAADARLSCWWPLRNGARHPAASGWR